MSNDTVSSDAERMLDAQHVTNILLFQRSFGLCDGRRQFQTFRGEFIVSIDPTKAVVSPTRAKGAYFSNNISSPHSLHWLSPALGVSFGLRISVVQRGLSLQVMENILLIAGIAPKEALTFVGLGGFTDH